MLQIKISDSIELFLMAGLMLRYQLFGHSIDSFTQRYVFADLGARFEPKQPHPPESSGGAFGRSRFAAGHQDFPTANALGKPRQPATPSQGLAPTLY